MSTDAPVSISISIASYVSDAATTDGDDAASERAMTSSMRRQSS